MTAYKPWVVSLLVLSLLVYWIVYSRNNLPKTHQHFYEAQVEEIGSTTAKSSALEEWTRAQSAASIMTSTEFKLRSEAQGCSLNREMDAKFSVNSTLFLDPDKVLYPGLIWGFNNQVVGFYQATYLAIRLNRTLVLPLFHAPDGKAISPQDAIDVARLSAFVSLISIEEMQRKCNRSFDVALQALTVKRAQLRGFQNDAGMSLTSARRPTTDTNFTRLRVQPPLADDDPMATLPTYPGSRYETPYGVWLGADAKHLRSAYNTAAKCAVYVAPFNSIGTQLQDGVAGSLPPHLSADRVPDKLLYSAVVDAVRRPPSAVEAAKTYARLAFDGQPYVAVHWRYMMSEWGGRRCRTEPQYSAMCAALDRIGPADVAVGIEDSLRTVNATYRHIYIAAMPQHQRFADEIRSNLTGFGQSRTYPKLDEFLAARYGGCRDWIPVHALSLVEMELCAQSACFFHSVGSTWSSNIRPLRVDASGARKPEFSAYDVSLRAMQRRQRVI